MGTNINRSFWAKQTFKLPAIACTNICYSDFTVAALQNLVEGLDLERATCLVCVPEQDGGAYEVAGESYPADHWIEPRRSSELTLLGQEVILTSAGERYLEKIYTSEKERFFVQAFQIRLSRYETQYALDSDYFHTEFHPLRHGFSPCSSAGP